MIALRNLWRAKLRSLISLVGIGGGVALLLAIGAISMDLKAQIDDSMAAYNLEVVISERRATSPFSSRISAEEMRVLQSRAGSELVPMVLGTRNEKWNPYALLIGAAGGFAQRIPLLGGHVYAEGQHEIMVGEVASQRMKISVGQRLTVDGTNHTVVGIFRTGSRLFDGAVLTDIATVQKAISRTGEAPFFTLALVQTADRALKAKLLDEVASRHPNLKALPGSEFAGSLRLLRVVDAFIGTLSWVAVGGVFLVLANTLVMAVNERTREIGILLAIGWRPWQVLRLFLMESAVLLSLGLLAGYLMALTLLHFLNGLESIGHGWIPVKIPLTLIGHASLLCIGVMFAALCWPAAIIWRMSPMEAIRND